MPKRAQLYGIVFFAICAIILIAEPMVNAILK